MCVFRNLLIVELMHISARLCLIPENRENFLYIHKNYVEVKIV